MELLLILAVWMIVLTVLRNVSPNGFTVLPGFATRVAIAPKGLQLTTNATPVDGVHRVTINTTRTDNGSLVRAYALFGPNPDDPTGAGTTIALLGQGPSTNEGLRIQSGWIYSWGQWPNAGTDRTTAGAMGTRMLVQHWVPAGGTDAKHRVFLIENNGTHQIKLTIDGADKGTLTANLNYVEFDEAGSTGDFDGPTPIAMAPADVRQFVENISHIAEAAGRSFPPI